MKRVVIFPKQKYPMIQSVEQIEGGNADETPCFHGRRLFTDVCAVLIGRLTLDLIKQGLSQRVLLIFKVRSSNLNLNFKDENFKDELVHRHTFMFLSH